MYVLQNRYKVLYGKVAEKAREIIRQSCKSINVTIIKGSIGKEHVHLPVICPPNLSASKLLQKLKGKCSRVLLNEYRELKRKYWGQHLWSSGYFCRSVATVTKEIIQEYIENQQDDYDENSRIVG